MILLDHWTHIYIYSNKVLYVLIFGAVHAPYWSCPPEILQDHLSSLHGSPGAQMAGSKLGKDRKNACSILII